MTTKLQNKALAEKVLFLDIDGVLTNTKDGSSFLCGDPSTYRISEKNLTNLMTLLEKEPKLKIVISSNWRRFEGDDPAWTCMGKTYHGCLPKLRKILKKWIIGDLTHERHLNKAEALELWFEDNEWMSKTQSKYVILEDDTWREGFLMHPIFYKHTIETFKETGFTQEDVKRALVVLED